MSSITLNTVWVGSWSADTEEANILHSYILAEANTRGMGDLVSSISRSSNGLVQFMIMPCGSKEGYPQTDSWNALITYAAFHCAGTAFSLKKLYVTSN